MDFKRVLAFINEHKYALGLGLLGLVTAVLMITIGFFRTLLILLLTVPLCFYGYLIDRLGFRGANAAIVEFFKRILK